MISRFDLAINLFITDWLCVASWFFPSINPRGALPYVGDIDMCHCEGYGFQAVYYGTAYINLRVLVSNRYHFPGN